MILPDANVLIYAVNDDAPLHAPSLRWLEHALSGSEAIGFGWVVLLAFLRITTRTVAMPRPLTPQAAMDIVAAWLAAAPARVVNPSADHAEILRGLVLEAGTAGNLTTDAHLAALAIEQKATVATFDRDFARFGVPAIWPGG